MNRLKATFRTKNGIKVTPEQQFNSYIPPPQTFVKEKAPPKQPKEEPEVDEEQQRRILYSSAEYVRRVRELIREKYRLDVYIWDKRDTFEGNRKLVMESCKQSDQILGEIYDIVSKWDRDLFDAEESVVVKQLRDGVLRATQEIPWQARPPWQRSSRARPGGY